MDLLFEKQLENFLEDQKRNASDRRQEMLKRDLTGTIKLLKEVIWPIFRSFDGFELEQEMKSSSGVSMFIDVFYKPYHIAFECDGFSVHAETITRKRFNFEKYRVRTMLLYGYVYVPFSWDELEERSLDCRNYVEQLLGKYAGDAQTKVSIYEKEVIRFGAALARPFKMDEVCSCLDKKATFCRLVMRSLLEKKLVEPVHPDRIRNHEFKISLSALRYLR